MNYKIEPTLNLDALEDSITKDNNDKNKYLLQEIIDNQSKVNSSILKYYQHNIGFDQKIIDLLKNGANTNQYFLELMKKSNKNYQPPSFSKDSFFINNKFYKFKNLLASFLIKNHPQIIGNLKKPNFYQLGYQTGIWYKKINNIHAIEMLEKKFKKEANNKNIIFSKMNHALSSTYQFIVFRGYKKDVEKISHKFSSHLQQLGVYVENILSKNQDIIQEQDFLTSLDDFIQRKFDIQIDQNQNLKINALQDLNDESQQQLLQNIILPKIEQEISYSYSFFEKINQLKKSNSFLNDIHKFAQKNQINDEMVIHLLKHNSPHLEELKDYKSLLKNKNLIIENDEKFQKLFEYNKQYITQFLNIHEKITDMIMNLNIPENSKEKFQTILKHKTIFKSNKSEIFTIEKIKNKIQSFFQNNIYSSKLKL